MKKKLIEGLAVCGLLAWIPASIAAFFASDARLDVKLLVIAGTSFIAMIAWFLKNE